MVGEESLSCKYSQSWILKLLLWLVSKCWYYTIDSDRGHGHVIFSPALGFENLVVFKLPFLLNDRLPPTLKVSWPIHI